MTSEIIEQNLRYYGAEWAEVMADECRAASESIHVSALSLHPPTIHGSGAWPRLWKTWIEVAKKGIPINFWLPAPTKIHPATRNNTVSGAAIVANGMFVHYVTGNRLLHAKTCIIDAKSVWIGSGNFTAAASHHNHEAYLRADCPAIAERIITRWKSLT